MNRSAKMGELIGKKIGRVLRVDIDKGGRIRDEFVRIRVELDIGKSLQQGVFVKLGSGGTKTWVEFKYEKMADFCFLCGRLGHGISECTQEGCKEIGIGKNKFGPWLRGEAPSKLAGTTRRFSGVESKLEMGWAGPEHTSIPKEPPEKPKQKSQAPNPTAAGPESENR